MTPEDAGPLKIYLQYEYLTALELAEILSALSDVFDAVFWSEAPYLIGTPFDRAQRLRIEQCTTGNSIIIELQALGQTVAGDPTLAAVVGGVAATTLAARLVIYACKAGHELLASVQSHTLELQERRQALESSQRQAELELARRTAEVETAQSRQELQRWLLRAIQTVESEDLSRALAEHPPSLQQMSSALVNLWAALQNDNITEVRINDEELKAPTAE